MPEAAFVEREEEQVAATRPFWSGTISFGLVSIPVGLYPANRGGGVHFRMVTKDGTPLARKYYSQVTGRDLADDDLIRGYEIEKGRYVEISDEELERLAPQKSRDIDLRIFVPLEAISPRYFERGYFLTPAGGSAKAYRLLAHIMEQTGRAGIATFVMRGKEYLVAIFANDGILAAETLRFPDEIRSPKDIGLPEPRDVPAKTVLAFEKRIEAASKAGISSKELRDIDAEHVLALVKKLRKSKRAVVGTPSAQDEPRPVPDLLEVLRQSLASSKSKPAATKRAIRKAA